MKLGEKLIKIQRIVEDLKKDGKGNNYKYVTGEQILGIIKPTMDEYGVLLSPAMVGGNINLIEKPTKNNKENKVYLYSSEGKMIWLNADDLSDRLEVDWSFTGEAADPSQAQGNALTYNQRYFLLKFFNVPTDGDDPDKRKAEKDMWEAYSGVKIYNSEAIRIHQKAVGDLMVKFGITKAALQQKVSEILWCSSEDLNRPQWARLEHELKKCNVPTSNWHEVYGTHQRIKNIVPIGQQPNYKDSATEFAKIVLEHYKGDPLALTEVHNTYMQLGVDMNSLEREGEKND